MNKIHATSAALVAIMGIFILTSSVRADGGGPFSIGGRGVLFMPEDGDDSWGGGVQARLRLPLFFGAEVSADYRHADVADSDIHDWPLQASLLMYLPKIVMVQPFLLGGGGWYHTTIEGPAGFDETDSRFGPHVGGGVEVNLSERWFLDATYRFVWLDKFSTIDVNRINQDLRDGGSMITAGLNFRI